MKKLLFLTSLLFCSLLLSAQDIAGSWNGALKLGNMEFRLVFHIEKSAAGTYTGKMDSPDQGAKSLALSTVTFTNNEDVVFEQKDFGIRYEGKYVQDSIKGAFHQQGVSIPLNMGRGTISYVRPQEPQAPYPYNSEDVSFVNNEAGIKLAGTLTYPKKGSKFPAVVLISGSGAQDRNEEIVQHKPFLVIADYLTRNGFAVLRYDDRGFGQSEGNFASGTTEDFATDAAAAVEYLKKRKEINNKKIGLIGHSEGGTICFINASKDKSLAFVVTLAAPALSGDSILMYQNRAMIESTGMDIEHWLEEGEPITVRAYNIVKYSTDSLSLADSLRKHYTDIQQAADPTHSVTATNIENAIKSFTTPWMRSFIKLDPKRFVEQTSCPVLALNGEKDIQVDANINLNRLEKDLLRAGNRNARIKKYPSLNHLFQHCTKGSVEEYGKIEETISPEVLSDISAWIHSIVK